MNKMQNGLVALGRKQFETEILPVIVEQGMSEKVAACISGSVSFGFADENSDVDFDVLIAEKLSAKEAEILENLLFKDYWINSKRISYGYDLKKSLGRYLRGERENYWDEFNPYDLYSIKNYIPVFDKQNRVALLKEQLAFYPKNILEAVVRGLWITASNSGEYNSLQTFKRGSESEANISLYRGYEAILRLVFILNEAYYPPTKWMSAGLKNIDNKYSLEAFESVQKEGFLKKYETLMASYKLIGEAIVENKILEREYIENYGTNFGKDYFIFETF